MKTEAKIIRTPVRKPKSGSWELGADIYREKIEELEKKNQDLKAENEALKDRLKIKAKEIQKLEIRFNQKLLRGKNRRVSLRYAEAILVHLALYPSIVKMSQAKAEKSSFPFEIETSGKHLAGLFGIEIRKARRILNQLVEIGAWSKVRINEGRKTVFRIGRREMNDVGFSVDRFYLNPENRQIADFYQVKKEAKK